MSGKMKMSYFKIVNQRIPERNCGIVGDIEPPAYNEMQRYCRDRGWIPIKRILQFVRNGLILEVGPGPGYLGLEWLKETQNTHLVAYDISEDMLKISRQNTRDYGTADRVDYQRGDVRNLPFTNGYFDSVISNDSFHEWAYPIDSLSEIYRVLKSGGKYHISDLRRDMNPGLKLLIWIMCHPKTLRPGWLTSINASYTKKELQDMLSETTLCNWSIELDPMRFYIKGTKS